jgi:hypothetical protein
MCLLVHQPAGVAFDAEFLADVYAQNRDGLGVMYADAGKLHVLKTLPRTADEFVDFYETHAAGIECVWHARMMTHGDIDIDNCHPYRVTDEIYLAHNGVLATGNEWDKTRSDTWHFIRNVIEPAVIADPSIILRPEWQSFIASMIGASNKFGLMTAAGDAVIINRSAGVTFRGAWLSNTYAWPASKYNASPSYAARARYAGYYDGYDWDTGYLGASRWYDKTPPKIAAKVIEKTSTPTVYQITKAARNSYIRGTLHQWVKDAPAKAAALVDAIEDDKSGESGEMVYSDPGFAVEIIADYFDSEDLYDSREIVAP